MQETKNYQIIDINNLNLQKIPDSIGIFTVNLKEHRQKIKELINKNPQTEFWLASAEMPKELILLANKLGIKNIIPYPINEDSITTYLKAKLTDKNTAVTKELKPLPNSKVMAVDDNLMNIQLLEEVLKGLNIELETFTKPQLAMEKIKTDHYDLFILDVLMPDISGFELANTIRTSPLNKNSPIMFMSALADYEFKMTGYNAGAGHYIEKPYDVELVKHQIYNILKQEIIKKQLNQSKDKMLAMITHDLKTPISAEITALQLLLKNRLGELNSPQQEILEDILSSAKFLKTMTDNILCSYKHSNNDLSLKTEKYNFYDIIQDSIEETKYLLDDKDITLGFKTDTENAPIFVDLIEIKRVLNNLIGNASDYAPPNSEITIQLKETKTEYECSISDKGCGISFENPNDIFECNTTLAKEQKKIGFGLGLFISKNIIIAHGGKIFANSIKGTGTTITFTLPKPKTF